MGSRPNAIDFTERIQELPSPPPVATRVLGLALDEDLSAASIARLIESDTALSLKVLKTANSPVYGFASKVASLEQAVVVLGLPTLQQILLSIVIHESLLETSDLDDPVLGDIWRHCLACAVAAEILAERVRPELKPVAFPAGLVHDCGKTLLYAAEPQAFEDALEQARAAGRPLAGFEAEAFGADHAEAGARLLEAWSMPASLVDVVRLHHLPPEGLQAASSQDAPPGGDLLLHIVALANELAHAMGPEIMAAHPEDEDRRDRLAAGLGLDAADLADALREMQGRFDERAAQFELDEPSGALYLRALQRAKSRLADTGLALRQARDDLDRTAWLQQRCIAAGTAMARAGSLTEVFRAVAGMLRDDLGAPAGGMYRLDPAGNSLRGLFWTDRAEAAVSCDLDDRLQPCASPQQAGVPEPFRDIFAGYPARIPDSAHIAASLGPGFHEPFLVLPLACDGEFLGEVLLHPPDGRLNAPRLDTSILMQTASLLAFAVRRLDLARQRDRRAERLARALRTIKEMQLQVMQTERLASVGQLAAGAAHEINNPLAIVYARTQLLEQKEQDPKRKKSIGQMKEQIERISKILRNLMEFARPDPPSFRPMDLNDVVEKALSLVRGGLEKSRIELRSDLTGGLPRIEADPRQVEQVLLNVLINAVHAMEQTGGELHVRTWHDKRAGEVAVSVADQGPGIEAPDLDKIFDPFFTTKAEGKGTGLGLSTSYGIVKSHGGAIQAESRPARDEDPGGAVFTVRLPLDRARTRPQRRPPAAADAQAARDAILVVDDEEHIRDILTEALQAAGYDVDTARNGREGLKKLAGASYRLMLLDIRMPHKSGLSLLAEITDRVADMPVIVLTGLAGAEEVEEAMNLGASMCIQKPFEIDALLDAVRTTLGERG